MLTTDVAIYLSRGWSDINSCWLCCKQAGSDSIPTQTEQGWGLLQWHHSLAGLTAQGRAGTANLAQAGKKKSSLFE